MNNEISDSESENIKRKRKNNKDKFSIILEDNKKRKSQKNSVKSTKEEQVNISTQKSKKDGGYLQYRSLIENDFDLDEETEQNKEKEEKNEHKLNAENNKVKKQIVPKQIFINKNVIEDKRKKKLEEEQQERKREIERQYETDRMKELERFKEVDRQKEKLNELKNKLKITEQTDKKEQNDNDKLKETSQINLDREVKTTNWLDLNDRLTDLITIKVTSPLAKNKNFENQIEILESLEENKPNNILLKKPNAEENLLEIKISKDADNLTSPQRKNYSTDKNLNIIRRTEIKRLTGEQKELLQDLKNRKSENFSLHKGLAEQEELTPDELKQIEILKTKLKYQSENDKNFSTLHRSVKENNSKNVTRRERFSTQFGPSMDRHFSPRRETDRERKDVLSLLNVIEVNTGQDSKNQSQVESEKTENNYSYNPGLIEEVEEDLYKKKPSNYVINYDDSNEEYEELMSPMEFDLYDQFYNKQSYDKPFEDDKVNNMEIYNKPTMLYKDRLIKNYFNKKKISSMPNFLKISEKDKKCQEIMTYTDMNLKDQRDNFYDKYCCLGLRKWYFWCSSHISKFCYSIVANIVWDNISLTVILINTLLLLISNPLQSDNLADVSDNYFLYFYTLEMVLKVFAFGFVLPENSYIKDPWNVLDFTVIVAGWISFLLTEILIGEKIKGLSGLRAFRILRPLKAIKSIKGLRIILVTLLKSLVALSDLAMILFFFFLIYAIAGVQMWQGLSMRRCMNLNLGYFYDFSNFTTLCTFDSDCQLFNQPGNTYICAKAYAPVWPGNQIINFDNTLIAYITVFVIASMEGWTDSWSYISGTFKDPYGINSAIIFLYYKSLLIIGGYYLLNLFLAVIMTQFSYHTKSPNSQEEKRSFYQLIKSKYEYDEDKELKLSQVNDVKVFEVTDVDVKLKLNDRIKKIRQQTFFIKKTPDAIDVNYKSFKDLTLLKSHKPEEKYNLSCEIKKESEEIKKEYDKKIKEAVLVTKNKLKQISLQKLRTFKRSFTSQKSLKVVKTNEKKLEKRKGTVYYDEPLRSHMSKKLITPAIEMAQESFKLDVINNKGRTITQQQMNSHKKSLKSKNRKSKRKSKILDVTIFADTSMELLINNKNDVKAEEETLEKKINPNQTPLGNVPTNVSKSFTENTNNNPPSNLPNTSEHKNEERETKKINNIQDELSIFSDDSDDEVDQNENLKTQLVNRRTLQKMKTLHSKHVPEVNPDQNSHQNPATSLLIDSNNKIYNLVSIKKPNSILLAIQKHKDEIVLKRKEHDKKNNLKTDENINEIKSEIKTGFDTGNRKSFLKVLKNFEDKKKNKDIINLTETEEKETKRLGNSLDNSLEISLFDEENLLIDSRSYSDLEMIPNTYKDDSYIHHLDIDELCKNNQNNKFTRFARNSLFNPRNGKRNTTIINENFGELFFSKINASLSKNIVIDMKEPRRGASRAITRRINTNSIGVNRLEHEKSMKKEVSQGLSTQAINYYKSRNMFKAASVEKNKFKYPAEPGVAPENPRDKKFIQKKKDKIPEHLRDQRKHMNYIYNLMDKDFAIKDKFKADYCADDVLGVKEKVINSLAKPKERNPIMIFNSSALHLQTQGYIRHRKFKLMDSEYNYHNHMMKNLSARTMDIIPLKSKHFGMEKVNKNVEIDFTVRSLARSTSNSNFGTTGNSYAASMQRSKSLLNKASFGPITSVRLTDKIKHRKNLNEKVQGTLNRLNYNTLSFYFLNEQELINKMKKDYTEKTSLEQMFKDKENSIEVRQQVSKIKVYDIETNSRKYVEWSGADVLNVKNTEKKFPEWNSKISKLEELKIILWKEGLFKRFFQYCRYLLFLIADSQIFDVFILFVVILNSVQMSLDGNLYDPEFATYLNIVNYGFNGIFILEFIIKFLGLGPILYFSDPFTYLDVFIIAFAILDMSSTVNTELVANNSKVTNVSSQLAFLRVFRIFRVLRFAKVLRKIKGMRKIFRGIKRSLGSVLYIGVVLLIFAFIFVLLGMSLLNVYPQFQDFMNAFYLVFQVMSIENWNVQLISMYQYNQWGSLYLIVWIILGNYTLFNLLISMLLDSYDSNAYGEEEDDQNTVYLQKIRALMPQVFKKYELAENDYKYRVKNKNKKLTRENNANSSSVVPNATSQRVSINKSLNTSSNFKSSTRSPTMPEESERIETENELEIIDKDNGKDLTGSAKLLHEWHRSNTLFKNNECEYSLFIFSQRNKFRIAMMNLIKWKMFDNFILFLIGLSTLRLIADTFISGYTSDLVFNICDISFTLLFTFEMVSKIISLGFVIGEGTYIKDNWNKIDFIIIVVSLIDLNAIIEKYTGTFGKSNLNFLKVLRLLRLLRPLRFISRNVQLKLIITSMFDSLKPIGNALFVVFVVFYMFSIVGINLFYDLYHTCYYPGPNRYNPVINFTDMLVANNITNDMPSIQSFCELQGGTMDATPIMRFSNILDSLVSCFVLSNMESWNQFMYQYNAYSIYYGLFFVIYLLVVSYFFLSLFQGIMFSCFHDAWSRERKKGIENNPSAEQYWDYLKQIEFAKPEFSTFKIPERGLRKLIYDMAVSKKLENFVLGVIICNICLMALNYEGSTDYYNSVLDSINLAFTCVFIFECIVKLIALGIRGYFHFSWNKFDFFVVLSSIVDIIITNSIQSNSAFLKSFQIIRVLRVLRLTRILRVLKSFKGVSKLLHTLRWSVSTLGNVSLLFLIIISIWAVMGCYLFDGITYTKYRTYLQVMNEYYNFDNFYYSFLLTFRAMTGESWPQEMYELEYVTIQQYDEFMAKKENPIEEFEELMTGFKESWNKYCTPEDKGYKMKRNNIASFFFDLRWKKCTYSRNMDEIRKYIMNLGLLNDHQNYVYFHDVLFKVIRHEIGRDIENKSKLTIIRNEEERLNKLIQFRIKKHIQETQMIKIKLVGNQLNKFNPLTSHLYYKISYFYIMYFLNHYEELNQKLCNKEQFETLEAIEKQKYVKNEEEDNVLIDDDSLDGKYLNRNFENDSILNSKSDKIEDEVEMRNSEIIKENFVQSNKKIDNFKKSEEGQDSLEKTNLLDVYDRPIFTDVIIHKNSDSLKLIGDASKFSDSQKDIIDDDDIRKSRSFDYSYSKKDDGTNIEDKLIMKENRF